MQYLHQLYVLLLLLLLLLAVLLPHNFHCGLIV
jgi:hypothetical protein